MTAKLQHPVHVTWGADAVTTANLGLTSVACCLCCCCLQLVLLECANIALNLLAQQRKRLEEERAADAFIGKSSQPNSKTAVTASTATAAAAPAVAAAAPSKHAGSIGDLVQPTAAAPRSGNSSNASGSTAIQTESGKQGGNGTAGPIQQQQRSDGEG